MYFCLVVVYLYAFLTYVYYCSMYCHILYVFYECSMYCVNQVKAKRRYWPRKACQSIKAKHKYCTRPGQPILRVCIFQLLDRPHP